MSVTKDLENMTFHNRDGAYVTQGDRHNMLLLFNEQLRERGYKLASARSLKPKHVEYLVQRWQAEGLNPNTIKNRISNLRWWAKKINKASIIPRYNEELGIVSVTDLKENRAHKLDMEKLGTIDNERIKLAMRLMAAFGLRREEAIKFKASMADKGDYITLHASWCKGGRARDIPIIMERQRALLEEVKAVAGNGSLIPDDRNYIKHNWSLGYKTLKAGIQDRHGLRHNYAQVRYKMLTGWECPKKGGTLPEAMNAQQRAIDEAARMQISEELGHSRLDITKTYLG